MIDNEIIKALECCIKLNAEPSNFEICKKDCPYKFNCCNRKKGISVEKDILDLINRQQAEIERLKDKLDTVKREIVETIPLIEEDIKTAKTEAVKEIIEQLEAEITISDKYVRKYNDSKDRTYNNSLREALKIVKEMVGD